MKAAATVYECDARPEKGLSRVTMCDWPYVISTSCRYGAFSLTRLGFACAYVPGHDYSGGR